MTPSSAAVVRTGKHHPRAVPVFGTDGTVFRACCSCGWYRQDTNTQRQNAVRAARRHVQETQP